MNKYQEIFDQVAVHLLTQNKSSMNISDVDVCAYRGQNGLKCAIGFLIADEDYVPEMDIDGKSVSKLVSDTTFQNNPSIQRLKALDIDFLSELQGIHDRYEPVQWSIRLKALAKEYKLNQDTIKER